MKTLQEMIDAARKRSEESEGEAKASAEAEVRVLSTVQTSGFTKTQADIDRAASTARSEGKDEGQKAARQHFADLFGVTDEELDEKAQEAAGGERTAEAERKRLEREKEAAETAKVESDAEIQRLKDSQAERDRKDAIHTALEAAKFTGKKSHAIGAIDTSKVKEEDGKFDATEAVEALRDEEFPGFEAPDNPETPPVSNPGPTGSSAAQRFEQRLSKRGRKAG